MQRYALFGHHVSHTLSPTIHRQFALQTSQFIDYQVIDVAPVQFESTIMEFFQAGGMGANLTAPYKETALSLCDVLSVEARRAGAVNTLMRQSDGAIFGHNTDGSGLVNHLLSESISFEDKSVLVLGAGGAAKGAVSALLGQPLKQLVLRNRTHQKALDLWDNLPRDHRFEVQAWSNGTGAFDLVVNATSASLKQQALPLQSQMLHPATICYDMFYHQDKTIFNQWAQRHGAKQVFDGLGMLVYQAALGFELWRQVQPDAISVFKQLQAR
jgi:shikimate dehydrogenase